MVTIQSSVLRPSTLPYVEPGFSLAETRLVYANSQERVYFVQSFESGFIYLHVWPNMPNADQLNYYELVINVGHPIEVLDILVLDIDAKDAMGYLRRSPVPPDLVAGAPPGGMQELINSVTATVGCN